MQKGTVIQILGPVVDVEFKEAEGLPAIFHALTIKRKDMRDLVLEVVKHLEPGRVRAIALETTHRYVRVFEANDPAERRVPYARPIVDAQRVAR